jgi:mRNA interferase HigB
VKRIPEFVNACPDSEPPLAAWYGLVKRAAWRHFAELKSVFPNTDLVGERTVFNMGQRYRLIARINYRSKKAFILHILMHSCYDKGKWKK